MSGVADLKFAHEQEAFDQVRKLLSYLPANNLEPSPSYTAVEPSFTELDKFLPDNPSQPYDIYKVMDGIFDAGSFYEVKEQYAKNIVIGFARMEGQSVGVVANNPSHLAGVLDINASVKADRFVRFCDAFNIPLITLVDVPGFLPGTAQEKGGIIRHGAKLLYAYCEATVPKLTVILRNCLLYTSPSPRDKRQSRMPSSA